MCFTLEWSVGIFSFQIALSTFVWLKCKAWPMRREGVALILWFALMEFIQVVNYLVGLEEAPWNGGCKNPPLQNKLLVVAGYVHVCFQPLVTHYLLWRGRIRETGPKDPSNERFIGVLRMLIISTLIDLTGVLEPLFLGAQGADVYDWEQCGGAAQPVAGSRKNVHALGGRYQRGVWFAANEFCAFKGDTHLGWSFPFPAPTYYRQGTLHFFAFFAPYFVSGVPVMVGGVLMLLTGPVLAELAVKNTRLESAATWCFWSAGQTCFPLLWDYLVGPYFLGMPFATTFEAKQAAQGAKGSGVEFSDIVGPSEMEGNTTALLEKKKKK